MKWMRPVGPRRRLPSRSSSSKILSGSPVPPVGDLADSTGNERARAFQFFDEVYRAFQSAESQFGRRIERYYDIGGRRVRLRFAGPALVPQFSPAFEHLHAEPMESADLTVLIWDSETTDTVMPRPPWPPETYLARGEMRSYEYGPFHVCVSTAPTTLSLYWREARMAVFWIEDAERTPAYEKNAPLRVILNWSLSDSERQVAHAAALGRPDGGVLLVGMGGSGKSTAASACLDSPLSYASDDYCLVAAAPAPHVHSLYNSVHVVRRGTASVRTDLPAVSVASRDRADKPFVLLYKELPGKFIREFPLKAILLPRLTSRPDTAVVSATPGTALAAFAPSTLSQLPGSTERSFRVIASLVRRVPAYHLSLGSDLSVVPALISEVIDAN